MFTKSEFKIVEQSCLVLVPYAMMSLYFAMLKSIKAFLSTVFVHDVCHIPFAILWFLTGCSKPGSDLFLLTAMPLSNKIPCNFFILYITMSLMFLSSHSLYWNNKQNTHNINIPTPRKYINTSTNLFLYLLCSSDFFCRLNSSFNFRKLIWLLKCKHTIWQ